VAALKAGRMAVVVDAPDRENEGDLVMAAEHATAEAVNFMATQARGLICVALDTVAIERLALPPMTRQPTDPRGTAFHVSVDLRKGTTTGISAHERAATIRALANPAAAAADFTRPGHVFPLRARPGGVLERAGHTEGAVELMELAGLRPAGVICEIARDDGEMMRLPELIGFAARHDLPVLAITELIAQRRARRVVRAAETTLPLPAGRFRAIGYRDTRDGREHVALVLGDLEDARELFVHVHAECFAGDVLGSAACECATRLETALDIIAGEERGVVVYVRGDPAHRLEHRTHPRDHELAADILRDLGVGGMRVLAPPENVAYLHTTHGTPEQLLSRAG